MFPTSVQKVRRIPWTSRDPPLLSPQTQTPMLFGGSLGHPGILPCCPLRHRPPCCPEDPLDIPGSSLGVPSDTDPHAVRRIPWTSRDFPLVFPQTQVPMLSGGSLGLPGILPWCPLRHRPPCCPEDPLVSPQTQASKLSGESLGHPGILTWCPLRHRPPNCLEDPLGIPGSSLGVPSDRGPHPVWRIPWTSRDPPLMFPQTQVPKLSGGSLGHSRILPCCPLRHRPPCCPKDPLDIPGSFLGVPTDTGPMLSGGSLGHPGILPWCPHRHRPPWCPEDPLVSPQTQASKLSGGSLGHPGILPWFPLRQRAPSCPEDPLDIPRSSLDVSSDTGPQAIWRIP